MLAFDFGTRRIGVAVGNTLTRVAHPLTTIDREASAARFAAIGALIDEWQPDILVVGRPVHADGSEHEMTARAERFARQLAGRFGLEVGCVDERFTTLAADAELAGAGVHGRHRRAVRDAVAAQLILQSWFDDDRRTTVALPDAEQTLAALADRMRGAVAFDARFVGIYSGGAWVAERLATMIDGEHPVGYIDVSFYRDDFSRTGLKPEVKRTELPFEVEGATIVLVDDVLYTGRSVRAAINELFDFGRPARVELAVLVDRGGRELPIEPTYTGARLAVARDLSIVLSRDAMTAGWRSPPRRAVRNPQLNADGELTHLLTLEGLPAEVIVRILDTAVPFASIAERDVKKVPLLRGRSVFNLFFENSTRTRTTFEIAAKRLSADVINLNIGFSSTSKGETLLDTVDNLVAMNADMFVVRHSQSGAPHLIAAHLNRTGRSHVHVVNAGDGRHAHPTQGLLDLFTIRHYKKDFRNLTVGIVGDVLHSRVARSLIHGLTTLGTPEVRAIGPKTLLPTARRRRWACRSTTTCATGLAGCDVVVMLRLQSERMKGALLPSAGEYFKHYGLTSEKLALAKPDAIVMHPGPMNRGVEIDSAVADGERSVILPQVTFGIAVRMAVMSILAGN